MKPKNIYKFETRERAIEMYYALSALQWEIELDENEKSIRIKDRMKDSVNKDENGNFVTLITIKTDAEMKQFVNRWSEIGEEKDRIIIIAEMNREVRYSIESITRCKERHYLIQRAYEDIVMQCAKDTRN